MPAKRRVPTLMSFCMAVRKKPATTSGVHTQAYAAMASPSGPRASGAAATKAAQSTGSQLMAEARIVSTFLWHELWNGSMTEVSRVWVAVCSQLCKRPMACADCVHSQQVRPSQGRQLECKSKLEESHDSPCGDLCSVERRRFRHSSCACIIGVLRQCWLAGRVARPHRLCCAGSLRQLQEERPHEREEEEREVSESGLNPQAKAIIALCTGQLQMLSA